MLICVIFGKNIKQFLLFVFSNLSICICDSLTPLGLVVVRYQLR